MANQTDPFAQSVHGTNPQFLVEKITRLKIYNSTYWKEQCFGLTSETIIDKAVALKYIGGTYGGNIKPSSFLCLVLKMLQLQPEKEIVLELIMNEDFKYVRALGAFYMRLVGTAEDIFRYLEPLYNDFRKLSYRGMSGWSIMHMDELIDALLRDELVCDMAMPHLVKRMKLEELGTMKERTSALELEMDEPEDDENNDEEIVPSQVLPISERSEITKDASAVVFDDDDDDDIVVSATSNSIPVTGPPKPSATGTNPSKIEEVDNNKKLENNKPVTNHNNKDDYSDSDNKQRHSRRDSRDRNDHKRSRRSRSRSNDYDKRNSRRQDSRDRGFDRRDSHKNRRNDSRSPDRRHRNDDRYRRDDSRDRGRRRQNDDDDYRRDRKDGDRYDKRTSRYSSDEDEGRDSKKNRRNDSPPVDKRQSAAPTTAATVVPVSAASTAASTAASKPKDGKLFDRMFKKKASTGSGKVVVNTKGEKVEITAPEGSVEYWNQIRESLGMSKLK